MSTSSTVQAVMAAPEALRLDVFWSNQLPEVSRARIQEWLKAQGEKPSRLVRPGENLTLNIPTPKPTYLTPQEIPLHILCQDDWLLVIEKPAGLVVHPGAGNPDKTLVNALLHHFPGLSVGDQERPGIVHRLDKDTSGLMIIAKNDTSHQALSNAFKDHEVRKIYRALCVGPFKKTAFELKTGHQRHPTNRIRFTTKQPTERVAHSRFEVLKNGKVSELRIEIFTGRTHQIRAQLADIGHPIIGDVLYGGPKVPGFNRHALHAEELFFKHPVTGEAMHLIAPANFGLDAEMSS